MEVHSRSCKSCIDESVTVSEDDLDIEVMDCQDDCGYDCDQNKEKEGQVCLESKLVLILKIRVMQLL